MIPRAFFQGKRQSLFDFLGGLDSEACIGKTGGIRAQQTSSAIVFGKPRSVKQSLQDLAQK